jgi:3'-5' exoribonuclease
MAAEGVTVGSLRPGDEVRGVYACTRKDRLLTRTGSPYLALELRDRTGTVAARVFERADELAGGFERGELVAVEGHVERFREELTLTLTTVARAAVADPAAFLPSAYRDLEELDGFFEHFAREVYDDEYARLLAGVVSHSELRAQLRRAPCTRAGHHAYLGGLLEHTVAVATLATSLCELHPRLNSDLLMTAALLHDIGRVREFTYGADFGVTDEGRLLGHVVIGERMIGELCAAARVSDERRVALLHAVLCHHGPELVPGRRFGSAEALALYRINSLDAGVKGVLEHGLG